MNETLESTDTTILDELAQELPCMGTGHPTGDNGHNPDEFASWWLKAPCCFAMQVLACNSRRNWLLSQDPRRLLSCDICGKGYTVQEWHFEPIGKN